MRSLSVTALPIALHSAAACLGYPHLDPVFLVVVNKRDGLIVLLNAIHTHAHLPIPGRRLQDIDVIDGLPITVVHLERLPIHRDARCDLQLIHFQPQPKK